MNDPNRPHIRRGTNLQSPRFGRVDVGDPDHLGPLFGFVGEETLEIGRRAAKHRSAQVGKLRRELRIDERGIDFTVEPVDDFGRSVPGRAEAGRSSSYQLMFRNLARQARA